MQRYRIHHHTQYGFGAAVRLGPHALRLRPREGHELRIESSTLALDPPATLRWHRDAEDNSVAIAVFAATATALTIASEVVIQQYNEAPLDFLIDEAAEFHPFRYGSEDRLLLAPYRLQPPRGSDGRLDAWIAGLRRPEERCGTFELLQRLGDRIHGSLLYRRREEPGVQAPGQTLACGSGSCRDFATLFLVTARRLGFAARFVSGYLHAPPSAFDDGSTHAWAEVYLPGAGWTGFDPTLGGLAGPDHIAVAVARRPEAVPPVAGSFVGPPGARLQVRVSVTQLSG